jgi:Skp family chaperone for outer membrane proteins
MSCIYKYKGKDYTKDEFYSLVRTTMVKPRTVQKYKKVLFPKGDTAAKIEGHQTLEEFIFLNYSKPKLNPELYTNPKLALGYFKSRLIEYNYNSNTGYLEATFDYFKENDLEHVLDFFKDYGFTLVRGVGGKVGLKKGRNMFTAGWFPSTVWPRLFNNPLPNANLDGVATTVSEDVAKELKKILTSFMTANGIRQESLEEALNILKKQGRISSDTAGISGISDALTKLVAVAEGRENTDILTEEVAHMAIAMLGKDHRLIKPALERLEEYERFTELFQPYVKAYQEKLGMSLEQAEEHAKMEILGHLLKDLIIDKVETKISTGLLNNIRHIWNKILNYFRNNSAQTLKTSLEDTLGVLATKIIAGETFDPHSSKNPNSIFFNVENTKLDNLAKDIQAELTNRIQNLENKIANHQGENITFETIARLKARRKALNEKLDNQRMAAAIWEHLKKLDEELQHYSESLAKDSNSLSKDLNRINDLRDFTINNHALLKRMYNYLEDVLEDDPKALDETAFADITAVQSSAYRSLSDLEALGTRLAEKNIFKKLNSIDPEAYKTGQLEKVYNKDLGATGWIQSVVGSLKDASNIVLNLAFRLLQDVHNEVNHEQLRVKVRLLRALKELEAAGGKSSDIIEMHNGQKTNYLTSQYNRAAIEEVFETAKAKIVEYGQKVDPALINYDHVTHLISEIKKKELRGEEISKEESDLLSYNITLLTDAETEVYNLKQFRGIHHDDVELQETFIGYTFITKMLHRNMELPADHDTNKAALKVGEIVSLRNPKGYKTRTLGKVINITNEGSTIEIIDNSDIGIRSKYETDKATYERLVNPNGPPITPLQKFYDVFKDELFNQKAKIPRKESRGSRKWLLPQRLATMKELVEEGRFAQLSPRFKRAFTMNVDDDIYGQRTTGIGGNLHKFIPIYFTQAVDPKLASHQVVSNLEYFVAMAENYKQLSDKKGELMLLQKHIAESRFKSSNLFRTKETPGFESATYKMLTEFLNVHLFGEKQTELASFKIGNTTYSTDKIVAHVYSWIEKSNLSLSIPIALSGGIKSNIDQLTERVLGESISFDSSIYATSETLKNIASVTRDMGARMKTNKISALLEYTNLGFEDSLRELDLQNRAGRILNPDLMYSPMMVAETDRNMRLLISILDNIREVDGKWLNKVEFLATKQDKKAAEATWKQLRDKSAYNSVKIVNGEITGVPKEVLFRAKDIAADLGPRLSGRVSTLERGTAFTNPWVKFPGMHRSWLISGLANRFKSQGTNTLTGIVEEGTYMTVARVFSNLRKNAGSLEQAKVYWKNEDGKGLQDFEKRNILRVGVDLTWMLVIMTITAALNALADEDDEKENWATQFTAYQASRLLLEQQAFWNPSELSAILKSPTAGVQHIDDLMELVGVMFFDWEPLKSGPYEGKTKFERFLWKRLFFKNVYELQFPRAKNQWIRSQVLKTGFNTFMYEPLEEKVFGSKKD